MQALQESLLATAAKGHIARCLRLKEEKAQRKKEAREAREMAKGTARQEEQARKEDGEKSEGKGADCNCNDKDDGIAADKKAAGSKTCKEATGNKSDDDKEGKKRKADGDPDKGLKTKKKKDEPKAKGPKPRGKCFLMTLLSSLLTVRNRPCGRGLAVRCNVNQQSTVCQITGMQEARYACQTRRCRPTSAIRHAS